MIVLNDLYDYGYKIYQDTDFFKFSIDSILLAEFIDVKKDADVLDICSGNAPIPLILLTKESTLNIDAVEIQKVVADLAIKSVKENNLENKITVYNQDILEFNPLHKYDIIVANPPYFKIESTKDKNINEIKRIARHEIKLKLNELIETSRKHLKPSGDFYMVQKTERFLETCHLLEENHFGIRTICFVHTKKGKSAEFFLIKATLSKKSDPKIYNMDIQNRKTYKNIFREC